MSNIIETTTTDSYGILVVTQTGEYIQHMPRLGQTMEEVEEFRVKLTEYESNQDKKFHLIKTTTTISHEFVN